MLLPTSPAGQPLPARAASPRLAFGGDYNPEQWPANLWDEDVRLMLDAGVDLVTVGVFSWAHLEVGPDDYRFDWLDDVLERLTTAGIGIDLATATASPPPWLTTLHPEMLPMTRQGTRLWPGGRQGFCPSSPVYRSRARALCRQLGERYGDLDGLQLWHVGNELGCHNAHCFCDVSAVAFRAWLQRKYDDVDHLNHAWGTAFWSQRYSDFEQILPPRAASAAGNPTQELDYRRFSSDELLANFVAERDLLHELSPGIPVTTNLMITGHVREMDYWAWAREVDVVSNDHYLIADDPEGYTELAFCADLTRGVAGGGPWLLMETSPGAVNWQPRNIARRPGELLRSAIQHVGRGADGVLFFQWRAARAGAEKFHAGIVPHAGTDTRIWREAIELRRVLDAVAEVAGSVVHNRVVILFDWQAWWACELDSHPSVDVTYLDRAHALHRSLTDAGVGVDLAHPEADLSGYDLIVVPTLYAVTDAAVERLREAVQGGATALVTYFSGIVDENDHVRLGGYPGAFRDLLGIRVEEFLPLREHESVTLSNGWSAGVWTEHLHLAGAESVATYVDGPVPDVPAVTRHAVGQGSTWYAATRLDRAGCDALVAQLLEASGVEPVASAWPGVEVMRRQSDDGRSWLFVVNHTDDAVSVEAHGLDLVGDERVDGHVTVDAGYIAAIREA